MKGTEAGRHEHAYEYPAPPWEPGGPKRCICGHTKSFGMRNYGRRIEDRLWTPEETASPLSTD